MEIWKDIKDYEGVYQVSDLGRIKTHENKKTYTKRHGERKWKQRVMKFRGYTPKTGYRVSLWKDGKMKEYLVSRLVAFSFLGGDINDRRLTVNHKDGNRMNNILDNLELVSLKENIQHGFENGLYSSCKTTILISKDDGTRFIFYSISKASLFLGRNVGYISNLIKKGIYETEEYLIKIENRTNQKKVG
jgi:hypothetical protein